MNIGDRLLEAWESMEVINYRNCKLAHKLPTNHLPGKKMAYFPKHQLPVFERYSVIDKLQEPKTSLITKYRSYKCSKSNALSSQF